VIAAHDHVSAGAQPAHIACRDGFSGGGVDDLDLGLRQRAAQRLGAVVRFVIQLDLGDTEGSICAATPIIGWPPVRCRNGRSAFGSWGTTGRGHAPGRGRAAPTTCWCQRATRTCCGRLESPARREGVPVTGGGRADIVPAGIRRSSPHAARAMAGRDSAAPGPRAARDTTSPGDPRRPSRLAAWPGPEPDPQDMLEQVHHDQGGPPPPSDCTCRIRRVAEFANAVEGPAGLLAGAPVRVWAPG
jgi:hypothetical protein